MISGSMRGDNDVMLSYMTLYINVLVGLVSSEASRRRMFFVEHRFRGGPLDGKGGDQRDRIKVGAVETVAGCYIQESARGRQIG